MAVIRRLPRYYKYLSDLQTDGEQRISSSRLGAMMGLTASQVRQDFNCFGGFGQQGYGYNVAELHESIGSILHVDRPHSAVIIGAGNLARALISNFNFGKSGFVLAAAFDVADAVVGTEIAGVHIRHVDELERYLKASPTDIAVLTLPKAHARQMAERLVRCGIRGIWNFTSIDLHLDVQDVPVENVIFSESLMVLSYRLEE